LGSAVLSLVVVAVSQLQNREVAEQAYLRTTQNQLGMLATAIYDGRKQSDQILLNTVSDRWRQIGHLDSPPDEHFLIVNNVDSSVILDTAYRGPAHHPPRSNEINQVIIAVREQMGTRMLPLQLRPSDIFQPEDGEQLLGSFRNADGRNWLLGIYRSRAGLRASASQFSLFGTLIVMCGLAMPVSLLLMYYTYHLAQRDQVLAERARSRLAAIVQDSEDAIFAQTFDGVITSWNQGAERLFGYTEVNAIGRKSEEIIPSVRSLEEGRIIVEVGRGERVEERAIETIRTCKDGMSVHILETISPVNDERGRQVGVSIIAMLS
jgi:PAS domain S-box-containing protein